MRYFAFLWAQIPVIIINGLAAMEDEEDDDSGLADLGGGEDEVEEDAEVLFIDDVKGDQSSSSRDVEKDEEDVGALASGPGILTHAGIVLGSAFFWYETVFLAMAALAIFWDEPLCTAVFCLEVVTFSGSQTVVAAIRCPCHLSSRVLGVVFFRGLGSLAWVTGLDSGFNQECRVWVPAVCPWSDGGGPASICDSCKHRRSLFLCLTRGSLSMALVGLCPARTGSRCSR